MLANLSGIAGIDDSGLSHLARLPNLTELNLESTAVTDAGLEHLKGLTKLKKLKVAFTGVTAEGLEKLKQSLPELDATLITADGG